MGRPRKPTAQLKLSGTYRADRHGNRVDDTVAAGKPLKPTWLKGDASAAWEAMVGSLAAGVLTYADSMLLAGAARWWASWRKYDGVLQAGEADGYKAMMMAAIAWKNFEKCAAKLGLNPIDRAKMRCETKELPAALPGLPFFDGVN